jgi:zinc and cadmium transporter
MLLNILLGTMAGGLLSLFAASLLSLVWLRRLIRPMVAYSTGLLLATSLLHLLREAFNSDADYDYLCVTVLIGLLFFFLLEKTSLFHHDHHHEGDGHHHAKGHDKAHAGRGGWMILVGSSVHNFIDGLLIVAAFRVSEASGWLAAFSILAHEVPHKVGDYMVLMNAGISRKRALVYNLLASSMTVCSGIMAYVWFETIHIETAYLLAFAASSFMYVSLADLIPQLHRHTDEHSSWRETLIQVVMISLGVATVVCLKFLPHGH